LVLVEVVEESLEQVGSVVLAFGFGIVVLGLQGGRNSMLVWKNVQFSQMDSNAQSSSAGLVQ
jgi:hypothetical protein